MVLVVKNLSARAGDIRDSGLIPESERSPGERNGNHSSIPAWRTPWAEEPGGLQSTGTKSWTRLSDQHFHFHRVDLRAFKKTKECSGSQPFVSIIMT